MERLTWDTLTDQQRAACQLNEDNPTIATDYDVYTFAVASFAMGDHGSLEHALYSACLDRQSGRSIISRAMINQAKKDVQHILAQCDVEPVEDVPEPEPEPNVVGYVDIATMSLVPALDADPDLGWLTDADYVPGDRFTDMPMDQYMNLPITSVLADPDPNFDWSVCTIPADADTDTYPATNVPDGRTAVETVQTHIDRLELARAILGDGMHADRVSFALDVLHMVLTDLACASAE